MNLSYPSKANKNAPIYIEALNITEHPWHLHSCLEVVYVLEGNIDVSLSIYNGSLKSGDVAIFNREAIHYLKSDSANKVLVFHFNYDFLKSHIPTISDTIFIGFPHLAENPLTAQIEQMKKYLQQLYMKYYGISDDDRDLTDICVRCLSFMLNNFTKWSQMGLVFSTENANKFKPIQFDRVNHILKYMYENYGEKLSLEAIANNEHLSKYYVAHLFSEGLGMPFYKYMNLVRTEAAQFFLYGTELPVDEICYKCGFSGMAFFRKTYLAYTGLTPSQDRKQNINHTINSMPMKEEDLLLSHTPAEIGCDFEVFFHTAPPFISTGTSVFSYEIDFNAIAKKQLEPYDSINAAAVNSFGLLFSEKLQQALPLLADYGFKHLLLSKKELDRMLSVFGDSDCLYTSQNMLKQYGLDMAIAENPAAPFLYDNGNGTPYLFHDNNLKSGYFYEIGFMNSDAGFIVADVNSIFIATDASRKNIYIQLNNADSKNLSCTFVLRNIRNHCTCSIFTLPSTSIDERKIWESFGSPAIDDNVRKLVEIKAFPKFQVLTIEPSYETPIYVPCAQGSKVFVKLECR